MKRILIIFSLFVSFTLLAQDRSLISNFYSVDGLVYNPAFGYSCDFLKLPVISSVYADVHHTGFSYQDIFTQVNGGYVINVDNLIKKSAENNYFTSEVYTDLFGMGLKLAKGYLNFGIRSRVDAVLGYPQDWIKLIEGNGQNTGAVPMTFMPYANIMAFNEIYASWSFPLRNNARFGFRVKILQGMADFKLSNSFLDLYTDPETYYLLLAGKLDANLSFPVEVTFADNGFPGGAAVNLQNPVGSFLLNGNYGLALDLGFIKGMSNGLTIYGSIKDLGLIRWKSNTLNYYGEGRYLFTGLYLDGSTLVNDPSGTVDAAIQNTLDSIQQAFQLGHSNNAYWSGTPYMRMYLGARKRLGNNFSVNGLMRNDFYNSTVMPSFTGALNVSALKNHVVLTLSASYMDRAFNNIGSMILLQGRHFQLYASTDNFLFALSPRTTRNAGLTFGMTYLFGCHKKHKLPEYMRKRFSRPADACPAYDMNY